MSEKRARSRAEADVPAGSMSFNDWKGEQLVVPVADWKPELLTQALDPNQRGMSSWWESIRDKYSLAVVNASRQIGKSFWACVLVTLLALVNPGWQIKYGAKTQKHARAFIMPHFRVIKKMIPPHLQPKWVAEDQNYVFDNGSTITIAGCDKRYAEALTGQHAHVFVIDEGGAIQDLEFIVREIALPQTLNTNGKLVIFSTPARTPGHAFKMFCDEAKENGTYIERQIFDNPRIGDAKIREMCKLAGGADSTTWQREYLVRHITEASAAVIPEATPLRLSRITMTETVLKATRSRFVDTFIIVVPEWNPHFTGVLWAHFDFPRQRIVIEDELLLRKLDSLDLAQALRERSEALWGDEKVHRVIAPTVDDDLIREMADLGWAFAGTGVKDFDMSNQRLRHSVTHRRGPSLWIHERCGDTRRQLEQGVWSDRKKREIESSKLDGNYPLLKAAVCLREDVNEKHDAMAGLYRSRFRPAHREYTKTGKVMRKLFGLG